MKELSFSEGRYSFRFKSQEIKNCLWESGSVLAFLVTVQELGSVYRERAKEMGIEVLKL